MKKELTMKELWDARVKTTIAYGVITEKLLKLTKSRLVQNVTFEKSKGNVGTGRTV